MSSELWSRGAGGPPARRVEDLPRLAHAIHPSFEPTWAAPGRSARAGFLGGNVLQAYGIGT